MNERPVDLHFAAPAPGEPAPAAPAAQLPIGFAAIPAAAPNGQHVVQVRLIVGPSAYILELSPDDAQQLAQGVTAQLGAAIDAVRRANLGAPAGLILPGAPMPPDGRGHG